MRTDNHSAGNIWIIEEHQTPSISVIDYEKAISTTGYGLFNILLFLAALPIAWTCIIDTTSTAFIINSVECDFELTVFRKGIAVSIIYFGMIISGPIWDLFLQEIIITYIDKRDVLIIGILLDALCNILWVHATSFNTFILLKFLSGMLIAGPLSLVMAYLAEFHAPIYQVNFTRWANIIVAVSNIIPAGLAATLLLRTSWFNFTIYNRFYQTWRVYLLICAMPSVLGLLTACLMPKSPKYLITHGKNHEALRLFRIMFCMNNFESSGPLNHQITDVVSHRKIKINVSITYKDKLRENISKLKMLFSTTYLKTISIILFLQFSSMLGFNVMRLWVPSIFVILNNFAVFLKSYYPANEYITMCEMIFPNIQKINYASCNYTLPSVESAVYVNSTIIATSTAALGFLFTLITNTRKKKIIVIAFTFLLSAIGSFGANWAVHIPYMLILLGLVIVASRITSSSITAYNIDIIPQFLRIMAVNLINFFGNIGAAAGNIIFSLMFEFNCTSVFLSIGFLMLVCTITSLTLLKKPNIKVKSEIERY